MKIGKNFDLLEISGDLLYYGRGNVCGQRTADDTHLVANLVGQGFGCAFYTESGYFFIGEDNGH